jgi:threonine/homoserine/homoserine lactone efflux protein
MPGFQTFLLFLAAALIVAIGCFLSRFHSAVCGPAANVAAQFVVLGLISVALNTSVDLIVAFWAAKARTGLVKRPSLLTKTRQASGALMCGLGATLLFARRVG